eukprot:156948-Pyramimonas_sp.AAC.1
MLARRGQARSRSRPPRMHFQGRPERQRRGGEGSRVEEAGTLWQGRVIRVRIGFLGARSRADLHPKVPKRYDG